MLECPHDIAGFSIEFSLIFPFQSHISIQTLALCSMISFYDWWHNLMFFCSFCLNCLSTCVIFNRYVPVGLANSCYNKDATPFSVLVLFNTGKARKGSSNYESNDIADDDPENAKGEFCRSHFHREQWNEFRTKILAAIEIRFELNVLFWSTPITFPYKFQRQSRKFFGFSIDSLEHLL